MPQQPPQNLSTDTIEGLFEIYKVDIQGGLPLDALSGLEITAGQRTMSGLIGDLTGQTFVLPVMLTGQNSIVLKTK